MERCRQHPAQEPPSAHARALPGCLAQAGVLLLCACGERSGAPLAQIAGGDPRTGKVMIAQTGCGVCHVIPGVRGARGTVGPTLQHFARRAYIGGNLPNRPDALIQWVADAPSLAPGTAMPRMPLTPQQARHVAAYLYTLR